MATIAGSGSGFFHRWHSDRRRLRRIQFVRRDAHHRGRGDQRLIGLFKGQDWGRFRLGFRVFNDNRGWLRDQRFA